MLLGLIFISTLIIQSAHTRSDGARTGSCSSMTPSHGVSAQEGSAPITFEIPDEIIAGQRISVTIRSTSSQGFTGYMILARDHDGNNVGRFFDGSGIQTLTCGQVEGNAVTQTNAERRYDLVLEWEPPLVVEDTNFSFFITLVQSFDTFWVNHLVPGIIKPSANIYDGCGVTKTCFGIPEFCTERRDCQMLSAVTHENDIFIFELLSMNSHNYVAMGLSNTPVMGDSSVIECVQIHGEIRSYTSWTYRDVFSLRENIDQNIIRYVESWTADGRFYCKVERVAHSIVHGVTFDLENIEYYLLIAGGFSVSETSVGFHQNEGVSPSRVLLTDPQIVGVNTSQHPLMLIHGALMIIAWIGLSSIGIVMARYFKKAWPDAKLFGKDMWFVWHITCMFLTWTFTIIGFILIFVYRGEWRTSAHAIMGCVVLFLAIIQPIGALFRPDPKSESRPLFNWLHKAFGNITHALAVITIFYAVGLSRAGLPHYTLYILAAFVSFYLLMHIIFTSINICGQMKLEKNPVLKKMPYNVLQKTLLGFFITVVIIFVVMLHIVFMLDFD